MCDVLHAYLWKLLAYPYPLVLPQLCKTDPPAHIAVDATEVRHTSLFRRTGERNQKERERNEEIASYDLARQANLQQR